MNEYVDFMKKNWKYVALGTFFILAAIFGEAKASYTFPYPANDKITMDVDHTRGGGTYNCPSIQACYIKVLEAEARGATQYCNNITIKRNGKIIWWRKYR